MEVTNGYDAAVRALRFFDTLPQPVLLLRGGTVVAATPPPSGRCPCRSRAALCRSFWLSLRTPAAPSRPPAWRGRLWSVAASYSQQGLLVFFQNGGAAPGPAFSSPCWWSRCAST